MLDLTENLNRFQIAFGIALIALLLFLIYERLERKTDLILASKSYLDCWDVENITKILYNSIPNDCN